MWIWKTRNPSRNQPDDPERTDYSHRWSVRLRKNNFSENPEPDGRRRRRLSLRNNYFRRNRYQISSERKLRRRVGMVFQQPIAFPHSIEKNLSYVLKYHGVRNKKEIAEKITESLQKAKLYDEVKDQLKNLPSNYPAVRSSVLLSHEASVPVRRSCSLTSRAPHWI